MAGIFQNGVYSMGFDMSPTAARVFTQASAGSANATTPFNFGYSWATNGSVCGILFNTNLTSAIIGFRIYTAALSGGAVVQFYDATAGAIQVALRVNSTGQLQFYLGSGTGTPIGSASAAGTLVVNTWTYIECKVTISATVGQVECYVNGSQVITTTPTQNTKSTANVWVNAFQLQGPTTGSTCLFDDWYMLDTTGSSPFDTYLGPIQARGEAPNANGGRNAWTPISSTNYGNVAHIPYNAANYNYDSNPGDYDMFSFPSLPGNVATVFAVNEWAVLALDGAGPRTVELNCYGGSSPTDAPSAPITPGVLATPSLVNQMNVLDPTGATWTLANANAVQLGVKLQS